MHSAPASSAFEASQRSNGPRSTEYEAASSSPRRGEANSTVVLSSSVMRDTRSRTILRSSGASLSKPGNTARSAWAYKRPPVMFFAPASEPRSIMSTLLPSRASTQAATEPAQPAPTTTASKSAMPASSPLVVAFASRTADAPHACALRYSSPLSSSSCSRDTLPDALRPRSSTKRTACGFL